MNRSVIVAFVCAILGAGQTAHACGGIFTQKLDSTAAINAQQALMVVRSDRVELTLRVAAEAVDSNFAWVIPVPAIDQVTLGDPALFDALDEFTKPQIIIQRNMGSSGSGSGGCLCARGAVEAGNSPTKSNVTVQHLGGGKVGNYEYDILAGTSAPDMVTWLTEAGYAVPEGTADLLQPYADNGMQFLWAKINTETLDDNALVLDPLQVNIPYTGPPVLTYPLTLSALSASPITSILIYVLANERFHVSNFNNEDISAALPIIAKQWNDGEDPDLEAAVDELTAQADGQLAITDFSQDMRDWNEYQALNCPDQQNGDTTSPICDLEDEHAHLLTRLYLRVPSSALSD